MNEIEFIQLGGGLILKINNSVHIINADHGFSNEVSVYYYTHLIDKNAIQEEY